MERVLLKDFVPSGIMYNYEQYINALKFSRVMLTVSYASLLYNVSIVSQRYIRMHVELMCYTTC